MSVPNKEQVDQCIELTNELQREYPAEFAIRETGFTWVATFKSYEFAGYGETPAAAVYRLLYELRLRDLVRTRKMTDIIDRLTRYDRVYRAQIEQKGN